MMKYNPLLDGVRGIAILLVLFAHFPFDFFNYSNSLYYESIFVKIGMIGATGVDLFFILSGFLITNILLVNKCRDINTYYKNFYVRRSLRIFPLYYGILIFIFFILPIFYKLNASSITIYENQVFLWTYTSNLSRIFEIEWDNSVDFSIGHFWSLAVEEHFYLVWPSVVFFLSTKHIKIACWTLLLSSIFAGVTIDFFQIVLDQETIDWSTVTRGGALLLGAIICLEERTDEREEAYVIPKYFYLILLLYFVVLVMPRKILGNVNHIQYYLSWVLYYNLFKYVLHSQKPKLIAFLSNRHLIFMGSISYGIYVFDGLLRPHVKRVLDFLIESFSTKVTAIDVVLSLIIYIVAITFIAWLSFNYYEKYFLKLKRFFK